MKILFDHQIFSLQKFGGVSRYFCELMKNMPASHNFILSLLCSDNNYLRENSSLFKSRNILPDRGFKGESFIKKKIYNLNQLYSRHYIEKNDFDLFHPTYYNNYFGTILRKPLVITIHDLILFKFEDNFNNPVSKRVKSNMIEIISNANRVIAISNHTRNDLVNILGIDGNKIDVIYHGYTPFDRSKLESVNLMGLKRYILYVGRRDLYKNFKTFAEAITPLLVKENGLKLICIGDPFSPDEITLISKLGIKGQIIQMNVNDVTLNALYSKALTFVFPSLYEGFGMPILEAFANDCPVCLSNSSCFPEIAGDAGAYFDPHDHSSILQTVEKVIHDSDYAARLVESGRIRLNNFSWAKTARETSNTYSRVTDSKID